MFASMDCTGAALAELLRAARAEAPREFAAVLGGWVAGGGIAISGGDVSGGRDSGGRVSGGSVVGSRVIGSNLSGSKVRSGTAHVRRVVVLPNSASDSGTSFAVDAVAFARCEHELRKTGDTFLGFAHSHPNGSTAPSVRDREQLWTDCVQVITDGHTWQAFVLDAARLAHPLATTGQVQPS